MLEVLGVDHLDKLIQCDQSYFNASAPHELVQNGDIIFMSCQSNLRPAPMSGDSSSEQALLWVKRAPKPDSTASFFAAQSSFNCQLLKCGSDLWRKIILVSRFYIMLHTTVPLMRYEFCIKILTLTLILKPKIIDTTTLSSRIGGYSVTQRLLDAGPTLIKGIGRGIILWLYILMLRWPNCSVHILK